MSIYLDNAKRILGQIDGLEEVKQAKSQLDKAFSSTDKTAFMSGSTIKNIIILLTPFLVYYKVSQVINLLKEVQSEISHSDESSSGFKKYI